ncbi:MAG: hypothetical protein QM676_12920 [Novosphingobium sp.]
MPPVDIVPPASALVAPGLAGGEAIMLLAVVGRMPPPEMLLAAAAAPPLRASGGARRWSADAWALVRSGGVAASAGPAAGAYGGSQAGAVLRYRLAPGNPHKPAAYLRASAALNGSGEREIAAGLSARPIGEVPVAVAAEGRLGRLGGRVAARPALMAATEIAPVTLPGKARAEFYLQAGYVGGLGATPFIDGQVRIDRRVAQVGPVELRTGAGAWGGAQQGAGRLDVGPSATLGIAQNQASARIGLDWRFRVKGRARPSSGPALTISAGF